MTRQTLHQVEQVIPRLEKQKGSHAQQLVETLQSYLPLVRQVIDQTEQRVFEKRQVPAGQKIVSLFEPHTAIIQRGKRPPHETEFGRKLWYSEVEGGIISEYRILQGNPPDTQQWVTSLQQHQKVFGHPPEVATGDRGVYSPENERVARKMGVKQVALPQPGAKTKPRQRYEKQKWFKAALRFRIGIEGRISGLKRARHLDRCLNRGEDGLARWVGWRIITNNLVVIAAKLTRGKPRRKPKTQAIKVFGWKLANMPVRTLAIDPQTPSTIYTGTDGGLFKSTDGGASWSASNNGLTNTHISALAIGPETPSTIYAGIDGGVFKSTDGGASWSASNNGLTNTHISALAIGPETPSTIYAGTIGGGVFVNSKTTVTDKVLEYFALGDSIASGRGLMDDTANGGDVDGCRQSERAYPKKVYAMLVDPTRLPKYDRVIPHYLTCDGATAIQPTNQDLLKKFPHKWFAYQVNETLDEINKLHADRPVLVTITIGANDLEWDPRDITNLVNWLYIKDGNQYTRHVDDIVGKVLGRVSKQVNRLLAKPNVAIVMTDYPNPANKKSLLFWGPGACSLKVCLNGNCGLTIDCYLRTEELVHKVNRIPLTIWKHLKPAERARFQPIAIHGLFHKTNTNSGHEAPQGIVGTPVGGCGVAPPNSDKTWIQYPSDPNSNSFPIFPRWVRKLIKDPIRALVTS